MRVALVAKAGHAHTGIGRYTRELTDALRRLGHQVSVAEPIVPVPPAISRVGHRALGLDAHAFFNHYPLLVRSGPADLVHISSQNLSTALWLRRPAAPVVVTVHDIIPYMVRDDPILSTYRTVADRIFDALALAGLRRADALISDSEYTRQALGQHFGIAPDRVTVVHLGIDHLRFRPGPIPDDVWSRYHLPRDRRYLIYVGSEDPRKDLGTLVDALALLRTTLPDVELIKVGRTQFRQQHDRLVDRARHRGVATAIRFLDDVADDDLPHLYGLASVCVMPSIYEGFGFPILEAMACGTPTVATRASSLTELAGDAGLLVPPANPSALADGIRHMLDRTTWSRDWTREGLRRAREFTWERAAARSVEAYEAAIIHWSRRQAA